MTASRPTLRRDTRRADQAPVAAPSKRVQDEEAQRVFSTSILISAVRCLLSYIVFPFVAPVIGIASGVGSGIGIVTSAVGIASNLWSIKRFHAADHRWKWPITAINVSVIGLLLVLLVIDIGNL